MEVRNRILKMHQDAPADWDPDTSEELIELRYQVRSLLADEYTGEQTETQEIVEWMAKGYQAHYGVDEDWEIVEVEQKVEEWLPTLTGGRSSFRLKGTLDIVVRDRSAGNGLWIVDYKTGKNLPKDKEIALDDQFALYQWLKMRQGMDIRGIIYQAVRTERLKTREMAPDERFKRIYTTRTQTELDTIVEEAYRQFRDAYKPRHDGRDAPRSPNNEWCRWRCSFTEPCLAARRGADLRQSLEDHGFVIDLTRH
jgi:hypothetical protein